MDTKKVDVQKKQLLEALKKSRGLIAPACEAVGVSRQSHYNWVKNDKEYAEAYWEIENASIDHVESKLNEKIDGVQAITYNSKGEAIVYDIPPSDTAIIYFLKNKGRSRGWNDKDPAEGQANKEEETESVVQLSNGRTLRL